MTIVDTSAAQSFLRESEPLPFHILGPLFFYFVGAGIATVMLGPLLPVLIERWHLQDAQAGVLFRDMFTGQLAGAWIASRNLRGSVIYGAGITAGGCLAMLWAGFTAAHLGLFGIGFGLGAGLTAGNVIAGTAVSSGRARILAILNVGWSIGAIGCPTLVRLCGPQPFFLITAIVLGLAACIGLFLPAHQNRDSTKQISSSAWPLPFVPLLLFALALLLYVGIENTLGGWLPLYAVRNSALLLASSISLCYWAAEFAGRSLMALVVQQIGESRLYGISLLLLTAAISILILARTLAPNSIVALAILCGLAIAPLYPLIVSFLLARTGSHPRLGPLFATASFGGATLPWLTGVVSTHFHGLRTGLLVPAVGSALLLVLGSAIAEKRSPRAPEPR